VLAGQLRADGVDVEEDVRVVATVLSVALEPGGCVALPLFVRLPLFLLCGFLSVEEGEFALLGLLL
jgi:hypothetical protein